jgi:hypothetical protein
VPRPHHRLVGPVLCEGAEPVRDWSAESQVRVQYTGELPVLVPGKCCEMYWCQCNLESGTDAIDALSMPTVSVLVKTALVPVQLTTLHQC